MLVDSLSIGLVAGLSLSLAAAATFPHGLDRQKPLAIATTSARNPFDDDLRNFIDDLMERWKIPGMSVAVVDGDDVYAEGYGYASLPDVKATPETLYYAGSTSKAFTAATLAHMMDSKNYTALAGRWGTPISSIIRDDFVLPDQWMTSNINLEDAVSHRTGYPRHDLSWPRYRDDGSKDTIANTVRSLRYLKPSASPRTTYQYCNLMFVTLGHVVETLTQKWLGDVIREMIWEPLGMTATFGDTEDAMAAPEHLAAGYIWDSEEEVYTRLPFGNNRDLGGAGLVISSVADYTKWVRCLLHETQPFSNKAHQDIRKTRMLTPENESFADGDLVYGLAWEKKTYHDEVVYKHAGTTPAYATQVYWLPKRKYGVVVMANTGAANAAEDEVVWRLIEDKLGVPGGQRYNISSSLDERRKEENEARQNLLNLLYPNRPESPLPSALNNSQLVGKYSDPGYGSFNIVEREFDGEIVLGANWLNTLEVKFNHVTGNYWLAQFFLIKKFFVVALAAEFKVGVDGKAAGLELQLSKPEDEINEGSVWFEKVN
ncbi:hypothetical protein LMH87_009442 [Akanthomyces muscarius]|uniref:Beta-lactamase-related domain-containing protein n=1 Tax=Akanthomyces muscarius TaxID=2231603 RepID=A0A9W8QDZ9_AKAMU|nr:hypothetical protein LMH87_009442 [Akanthomyces muscarius]KAJ4152924.1 hypothetical protein LMH87_009442 [Akanthomyces muscarius]